LRSSCLDASNGDVWLKEIDKTIEKLVTSGKESSQKIEEMTGKIQLENIRRKPE